jgi:hypothetical protein
MVSAKVAPSEEISEEDAQGQVKAVYKDIKQTLRVPLVNLVFRVLANHPDYLQLAWRQLKPNIQTVFFEQQADAIRARAVDGVASMSVRTAEQDPAIGEVLNVFHYVNPKLLLAVAALRTASNGELPRLEEIPAEARRQIVPGIPGGVPSVPMVDPDAASPEVRAIFEDILTTLNLNSVNSDYRALAHYPDYFTRAWDALKPMATSPDYQRLHVDLRRIAEEAVLRLPFRVEASPNVMRLCGISEREIDAIRGTLDRFYRLLPGLTANVAFLAAGVHGAEAARSSPFPVTVL